MPNILLQSSLLVAALVAAHKTCDHWLWHTMHYEVSLSRNICESVVSTDRLSYSACSTSINWYIIQGMESGGGKRERKGGELYSSPEVLNATVILTPSVCSKES